MLRRDVVRRTLASVGATENRDSPARSGRQCRPPAAPQNKRIRGRGWSPARTSRTRRYARHCGAPARPRSRRRNDPLIRFVRATDPERPAIRASASGSMCRDAPTRAGDPHNEVTQGVIELRDVGKHALARMVRSPAGRVYSVRGTVPRCMRGKSTALRESSGMLSDAFVE